jgi:hypothetical protein
MLDGSGIAVYLTEGGEADDRGESARPYNQ